MTPPLDWRESWRQFILLVFWVPGRGWVIAANVLLGLNQGQMEVV